MASYQTDMKYLVHLAFASFRSGHVEMAFDVAKKVVDRFFVSAKEEAELLGEPITQILAPDNIMQSRLGELAVKLDLYAKAKVLGLTPQVKALLPILKDEVVNGCLYECLKDCLSDLITFPSGPEERDARIAKYDRSLVRTDYFVDAGKRGLDMNHFFVLVQRKWEESEREPLLKLPDKYDAAGRELLRKHGLPEDAWFVCFHARSGGYHADLLAGNLTHYRNSNIEGYVPAMEAVRDRGGWVVRIGDSSMPPLPEMEGVIDYAVSDWREDWIDVFLLARSRFLVCVPSGPCAVAQAFGVPIVGVNCFPFGDWQYSSRDIMIFKPYRRSDDGSYLTVSEMVGPPVRGLLAKNAFDARGIEVIENSPDDIRATVVEMMDKCDGRSDYSAEDDDLQQRFKALADPFDVGVNSRFGRDFLGSVDDFFMN